MSEEVEFNPQEPGEEFSSYLFKGGDLYKPLRFRKAAL
jgi:hypothetical protein